MNLNDLETFVLVAEVGTFTGAAEELGVPKSTVSRRVSRLEDELGIALLKRGARSISLTQDGRAIAERCAPAIRELSAVERGLGDVADEPRGRLRITAPVDVGSSRIVTDSVAAYARAYPKVEIELEVTNRFVDLLDEQYDIAFRGHAEPLAATDELLTRTVSKLPFALYASAEYLERGQPFESLDDLAKHRIVAHSEAHRNAWPVEPDLIVNDYLPLAALLAAGVGVGALPTFMAEPWLERGELAKLDVDWGVEPARLSLVWLRSRHLAPRVRAFIDLVASGV